MKNATITQTGLPREGELEKINSFTRRPFAAEEVYTFSITLCDNDIDRDFECFTVNALSTLADMYVGKTGIFDHSMRGKDQVARIFSTAVEHKEGVFTRDGRPYSCLTARAYMPRTAKNEELITDIDAGINKEVSVGCAMTSAVCSICGTERSVGCTHKNGRHYKKDGKKALCHTVLDNPSDAYEWSFVAIPAQPKAGVTKALWKNDDSDSGLSPDVAKALNIPENCEDREAEIRKSVQHLQKMAAMGEKYVDHLTTRAAADLLTLCGHLPDSTVKTMLNALSPEELGEFSGQLRQRIAKMSRPIPQTAGRKTESEAENNFNFIV